MTRSLDQAPYICWLWVAALFCSRLKLCTNCPAWLCYGCFQGSVKAAQVTKKIPGYVVSALHGFNVLYRLAICMVQDSLETMVCSLQIGSSKFNSMRVVQTAAPLSVQPTLYFTNSAEVPNERVISYHVCQYVNQTPHAIAAPDHECLAPRSTSLIHHTYLVTHVYMH